MENEQEKKLNKLTNRIKEVAKLNNLINSITASELQEVLMFVSTICQNGKLKKLKKYLKKKPIYNQFI